MPTKKIVSASEKLAQTRKKLQKANAKNRVQARELKIAREERDAARKENKRLKADNQKLTAESAKHREESRTNELTELPNRRAFGEVLGREMIRAHRTQRPLVLCLADIDGLKFINDTYGHPAGNKAIVRFAQLLCSAVRDADFCAHLSGDEFALILPETSVQHAQVLIDRLKSEMFEKGLLVEVRDGETVRLRASFGIAEMLVSDSKLPHEPLEEFVKRADDRLYEAKLSQKMSGRGASD